MIFFIIGANLVMGIALFLTYPHLPPQIPLFYSQPWGENQLAEQWMIGILPLLMNGFILLNFFLQKKIFGNNTLVKKMFYYFTVFIILTTVTIFLKVLLTVT